MSAPPRSAAFQHLQAALTDEVYIFLNLLGGWKLNDPSRVLNSVVLSMIVCYVKMLIGITGQYLKVYFPGALMYEISEDSSLESSVELTSTSSTRSYAIDSYAMGKLSKKDPDRYELLKGDLH
ncbi:hypothetical protein VTL71DRAFT_4309 [Oculimacula yallundae]|uniref:Uncharacterized protein n=1 Tax=Oculimacula yallundae TaxID=86028 RepID=A0ABR4C7R6_9HELO